MGPFAVGALISGGAHLLGSVANVANNSVQGHLERRNKLLMQAKEQQFQLHMASTNYQRAVKDLKLAGLNPSLAATAGTAAAIRSTSDVNEQRSLLSTLDKYLRSHKHPSVSSVRSR